MYLEYCAYNKSFIEDVDVQSQKLFRAVDLKFDGLAIPLYLLREVKTYFSDLDITIATPVDYPNGTSDKKVRQHETVVSLQSGANAIDLVANPYLIKTNKYSALEKETETHLRICEDYNADLRIILNYDLHNGKQIARVSDVLKNAGVDFIIPSAGFQRDDIYNNLLMSTTIEKHSNINVIASGQIWLEKQYMVAIQTKIFGLRLYSLNIFEELGVKDR